MVGKRGIDVEDFGKLAGGEGMLPAPPLAALIPCPYGSTCVLYLHVCTTI